MGRSRSGGGLMGTTYVMTPEKAAAIEAAVNKALDAGLRTGDMMAEGCTPVSCSEMGDAILKNL